VPLARVGEFTADRARVLVTATGSTPLDMSGWDHFTPHD